MTILYRSFRGYYKVCHEYGGIMIDNLLQLHISQFDIFSVVQTVIAHYGDSVTGMIETTLTRFECYVSYLIGIGGISHRALDLGWVIHPKKSIGYKCVFRAYVCVIYHDRGLFG